MIKCVCGRLKSGSSGFDLTFLVGLALSIALLAGLSGCVVQVVPPPTPVASAPGIALDPVAGPVGTQLTVRGAGWRPGSTVSLYLTTSDQTELPPSAVARLAVGAAGSFETQLLVPTTPEWEQAELALVVARDAEIGASAQALFSVIGPLQAGPALAMTPTTPELGTSLGVTTAQLNVRAGPGPDYPVLGGLEAGQDVEITGLGPDGGWWQIRFAAADGHGWVSASYVSVPDTENVPIVYPPPPSPATPSKAADRLDQSSGQPATPTATIPVEAPIANWRGEYYDNRDLSGAPVLVRDDAAIIFDWGAGSPAAGMPADNFTVRWSRDVSLEAGTYRFHTRTDDGVRLWVDGGLVIDQWRDGLSAYAADVTLADGLHRLRMEYYEHAGNALAQLAWERPDSYPDWKGEYFDNPSLAGLPVLARNDPGINFDWGPNSPGPGVPAENFSARWSRSLPFETGNYQFKVVVDDGARLWVDDNLVIDSWRTGEPKGYSAEVYLDGGNHRLRLEYFDFRYDAQVHLSWERLDD